MPTFSTDPRAHLIAVVPGLPPDACSALAASPFGPFETVDCADREEWLAGLADRSIDAVVLREDGPPGAVAGDSGVEWAWEMVAETAVLVVVEQATPAVVLDWLARGVQDVLSTDELVDPGLARRIRAAVERKRLEREARTSYATDLDTGLPHQQQLIEHMSQLLALREREPAPMAVLAFRVEGLATIEARFGRNSAGVVRRKVGVRLRAGVRASDVVASLGDDSYAVLLGSVLAPADAGRVGAKLLKALVEPFRVSGQEVGVAAALGIGQYPEDGNHPDVLLRRAVGLAAAAQAQGRAGFSNFTEVGGAAGAANDE